MLFRSGTHCGRCGKILERQEIIPALASSDAEPQADEVKPTEPPQERAEDAIAVKSIQFDKRTYRVRVGKTVALTVRCTLSTGKTATNQYVTFSSSDPKVISVDEYGVATAHAHGHATITAHAESGATASCTVKTWVW